jgi:hypothetical protein
MIFEVGGLIGEVDFNESLSATGGRPGEKNSAENWKVLHPIGAINNRICKKIDLKPAVSDLGQGNSSSVARPLPSPQKSPVGVGLER